MFARRSRYLLVCVAVTVCLAGWSAAQISTISDTESQTGLGGNNSIVGTVFLSSGQPLARRVRIVLSSMVRGDRSGMTTDRGNFAFRGLPPGSYTITIDKEPGFKPYSGSVDIIQIRGTPSQTVTLNPRLEFSDAPKTGVVDASLAGVPERAQELFRNGMELAAKGERAAAIEKLKLAVAEYPRFMRAYNEMGVIYLRAGNLAAADEALKAAMEIDPEAFPPIMNRGIVLVTMRRFDVAEPILRKAVSVNESSAAGRYFLGQALANLGRFDEAVAQLEAAVGTGERGLREAYRLLAILYNSRGNKRRAIAALETYVRLAPGAKDIEKLKTTLALWKSERTTKSDP